MEKERVNLFVTKEQFELIENSVEERRELWKRTLEYHAGNENVGGTIEECSDEAEAEYVSAQYDELYRELQSKMKSVGINRIEILTEEDFAEANSDARSGACAGRIEVFAVSRDDWEAVVYAYQTRDNDFLFFPSTWEMIQFFDAGKEPEHRFGTDAELHAFLRYWSRS